MNRVINFRMREYLNCDTLYLGDMDMNYSVVLPCAGKGTRMGISENKLFLYLGKQMVIEKAVQPFVEDERCKQIIIVFNKDDEERIKKVLSGDKFYFTDGGAERSNSVYDGLQIVSEQIVLVHDGARPFVTKQCIDNVLNELESKPACICGVPVKDTIKIVENGKIVDTPDRSTMWQAQTPQGFNTQILLEAYEKAIRCKSKITDDASAVELFSDADVAIVMGDYSNIKITTKEDLIMNQ